MVKIYFPLLILFFISFSSYSFDKNQYILKFGDFVNKLDKSSRKNHSLSREFDFFVDYEVETNKNLKHIEKLEDELLKHIKIGFDPEKRIRSLLKILNFYRDNKQYHRHLFMLYPKIVEAISSEKMIKYLSEEKKKRSTKTLIREVINEYGGQEYLSSDFNKVLKNDVYYIGFEFEDYNKLMFHRANMYHFKGEYKKSNQVLNSIRAKSCRKDSLKNRNNFLLGKKVLFLDVQKKYPDDKICSLISYYHYGLSSLMLNPSFDIKATLLNIENETVLMLKLAITSAILKGDKNNTNLLITKLDKVYQGFESGLLKILIVPYLMSGAIVGDNKEIFLSSYKKYKSLAKERIDSLIVEDIVEAWKLIGDHLLFKNKIDMASLNKLSKSLKSKLGSRDYHWVVLDNVKRTKIK